MAEFNSELPPGPFAGGEGNGVFFMFSSSGCLNACSPPVGGCERSGSVGRRPSARGAGWELRGGSRSGTPRLWVPKRDRGSVAAPLGAEVSAEHEFLLPRAPLVLRGDNHGPRVGSLSCPHRLLGTGKGDTPRLRVLPPAASRRPTSVHGPRGSPRSPQLGPGRGVNPPSDTHIVPPCPVQTLLSPRCPPQGHILG